MVTKIVLTEDSPAIKHLSSKDKRLSKLISMVGNIEYQPYEDGYAFLVHEIIEQMLSIKAASNISDRLNHLCNNNINPFSISSLSIDDIQSSGMSRAKAEYIKNLTSCVQNSSIDLKSLSDKSDMEVIKELTALRGIGDWTAKMYLIFVLNRPDVLPLEDGAFLQSYKWLYKTEDVSKSSIIKKCNKWSPYSSIAARYMYRALDMGFTKTEFHLYK